MKYVTPYGRESEGDNAQYINGDPSIGRQGSIPPANAFEHPMREIVGVIEKAKLVPSETDLLQLTKSVRSQRINFADDTGSANVLSVAFDPPLTAYTLGLPLHVRVHMTNTGAATIDAGAGRVAILRTDGNSVSSGDLPAGGIADMIYDGTNFQLVNFLGSGGSGTITNVYSNIPYVVDTSATPNVITANFSPAIVTLTAGVVFLVKIANTNTGSTVINVNAFSNRPMRVNSGGTLLPGDVAAGDIKLFVYDGTNFYIEPNVLIPSDVTINVPAQFAQPQDALNAISRKTIAKNAVLTIQIAAGVFNGMAFQHKNASRIIIKGTMLATPPTFSNFTSNPTTNIAMLRSRYGTEILANKDQDPWFPSGSPSIPDYTPIYKSGFQNTGGPVPLLRDLLITGGGPGVSNVMGINASYNGAPAQNYIHTNNVAVWGCYYGYWSAGTISTFGGSVSNCTNGFMCYDGAVGSTNKTCVLQNVTGFMCYQGSYIDARDADVYWNSSYGVYCATGSSMYMSLCNIFGNGYDVIVLSLSIVSMSTCGASVMSPAPNTGPANNGAYLIAA